MNLSEKIKQQGFGWIIYTDGTITKQEYFLLLDYLKNGNVFLTENEAEKENYRRQLEFKLQEWQRNNDEEIDLMLTGKYRYSISYELYSKKLIIQYISSVYPTSNFRVFFTTEEKTSECIKLFKDEILKYYYQE